MNKHWQIHRVTGTPLVVPPQLTNVAGRERLQREQGLDVEAGSLFFTDPEYRVAPRPTPPAVALAEEAGVKRHVLTHTDLKDLFYAQVRALGQGPDSERRLRQNSTRPDTRWPTPTSASEIWRTTTSPSPAS